MEVNLIRAYYEGCIRDEWTRSYDRSLGLNNEQQELLFRALDTLDAFKGHPFMRSTGWEYSDDWGPYESSSGDKKAGPNKRRVVLSDSQPEASDTSDDTSMNSSRSTESDNDECTSTGSESSLGTSYTDTKTGSCSECNSGSDSSDTDTSESNSSDTDTSESDTSDMVPVSLEISSDHPPNWRNDAAPSS